MVVRPLAATRFAGTSGLHAMPALVSGAAWRANIALGSARANSAVPGRFRYAYCHGFLSGPESSKGQQLRNFFARHDAELALLDLNTDSDPSKLSFAGAQAQLDAHWHADATHAPLRLVGSSFGGTAALAYANRHPERVDRLLLLCPGFDLGARWESIVGADALAAWERVGMHTFALPRTGEPCEVPWAFVEESRRQPPLEPPPCPTVIVHATEDEVVPWTLSADFVERCPDAARPDLVLVDDDHALCAPASLAAVEWEAARLFEFESRDD